MKKCLLSFLIFLLLTSIIKANTIVIHAKNYQFTPSTVNAFVGDTIQWIWDEGFHTTTSTSVPSGASSWNAGLTSATPSFKYKLTVAGKYDYECVYHAPAMVGVINASSVLPVVLSNFSIRGLKADQAIINWSTSTEENVEYFSLQKSSDGNKFDEIARIKAAGNSTVINKYSYTDNMIKKEDRYLYYMLVIVDKDGSMQSSEIKMFKNSFSASKLITQLSPNPVSGGHLMIQFNSDKEDKMIVQLYDAGGRLVKETEMSAVQGLNNGHIHLSGIAAGVYTITFSMNGVKEKQSIVIE